MDLVLIVRDALASSLAGNLSLAIGAKETGKSVGVFFTGEALAALAHGSFEWPRELSGQRARLALANNAAAAGLPIAGRGEGRAVDVKGMVARARDAGVALFGCPTWTPLLGLSGHLPEGFRELDTAETVELFTSAKSVVGAL